MFIVPPFLKAGDHVGICAPARSVTPAEIELAIRFLARHQLRVQLAPHLFVKHHQFAGTDAQRAADLQQMLDDESIAAIFVARGGYGSARLLPLLHWDAFLQHPKWIVGYSDATVWHLQLARLGVVSLHSAMPMETPAMLTDTYTSLRHALLGANMEYTTPPHPLNMEGVAQGRFVGGNLSIIYSLQGVPQAIDTDGAILFIEDVGEYLYHIDRMMTNLSLSEKLAGLKGVVVGGMTQMQDNLVPYGYSAYQIIHQHLQPLGIPVCFGFPAGHTSQNLALYMGASAALEVTEKGSVLKFSNN